jgi:hypothetical protein
MTGDVAVDPQAAGWGGLSWSPWYDFDQAHCEQLIPATSGLYRFSASGHPGLLYIGESGAAGGRRARLDDLARGRRRHTADFYLNWRENGLAKRPHRGHYAAPYLRLCEDAGYAVEVSWALGEHTDTSDRRAVEKRLIRQHQADTGWTPPIQYGGAGVIAYLNHHTEGSAG